MRARKRGGLAGAVARLSGGPGEEQASSTTWEPGVISVRWRTVPTRSMQKDTIEFAAFSGLGGAGVVLVASDETKGEERHRSVGFDAVLIS